MSNINWLYVAKQLKRMPGEWSHVKLATEHKLDGAEAVGLETEVRGKEMYVRWPVPTETDAERAFAHDVKRHMRKIEVRYCAALAWLEEIGDAAPHARAKSYALGFDR